MKEDTEGWSLWEKIIETVTVYSHVKRTYVSSKKKLETARGTSSVKINQNHIEVVNKQQKNQPNQMDGSTKRKLTKGLIEPEARIDLHDMTQEQAYGALINFINRTAVENKRTVLVITGKGKNMQGVLRSKIHLWLETDALSNKIISVLPAAAKHGGAGAFYVRLKNNSKIKK